MDRSQHHELAFLLRLVADRLGVEAVEGDGNAGDSNQQSGILHQLLASQGVLDESLATYLGFNTAARGPFNRLRVTEATTIFDSKLLFDKAPLTWDESLVSGTGITSTWTKAYASTTLTSTAATAGRFVRQTYQRFNYQPGKGNLVDMTFTTGTTGTGATKAAGQFDDANGIFFSDVAGTPTWTIRSSRTGSPVETSFAQGEWSIDNFDGTGPSGITLDLTKSQIIIIDYQWLGVGRVRVGFDINGVIYYCHEFNHANVKAGVYMSTPNLPLRYELTTTAASGVENFECICSTIISEGGTNDIGILRYESTNGAHVDCNTADAWYPIIGIRLKSTHIGATIKLASMSMINEAAQDFEWAICMNPTIATGTPTWNSLSNSAVETMLGASTITVTYDTGIWFTGAMVKSSSSTGATDAALDNAITLGSTIGGTVDQVFLCCRPLAVNADIEATLSWREIL